MIEVFGIEVEKKELEQWMDELHKEWESLDEWDKEYYDDFDEFADMRLHSKVWSEE